MLMLPVHSLCRIKLATTHTHTQICMKYSNPVELEGEGKYKRMSTDEERRRNYGVEDDTLAIEEGHEGR